MASLRPSLLLGIVLSVLCAVYTVLRPCSSLSLPQRSVGIARTRALAINGKVIDRRRNFFKGALSSVLLSGMHSSSSCKRLFSWTHCKPIVGDLFSMNQQQLQNLLNLEDPESRTNTLLNWRDGKKNAVNISRVPWITAEIASERISRQTNEVLQNFHAKFRGGCPDSGRIFMERGYVEYFHTLNKEIVRNLDGSYEIITMKEARQLKREGKLRSEKVGWLPFGDAEILVKVE